MAERERNEAPVEGLVPCRRLPPSAPFRWLRAGLADWAAAPRLGLLLGAIVVLLSVALSLLFWWAGGIWTLLAGLGAFVFAGPLLAIACYEVPRARLAGRRPSLAGALALARRTLGEAMVLAILLLVLALLWIRAGSLVHVFLPAESEAGGGGLWAFLGVGGAVGALFATLVFAGTAFSLPLVADRRVDMVVAVLSSARAVLANRGVCLLWAALILGLSLLGMLLLLIGLGFVLPWLGFATFHAAREALAADAWPLREQASGGAG
ncbi:MAG: DUF2189 domain-containing protein [Xanthomonadales bacterium]|nr:DUF2189 domain-containing protein [Xanthomonadales bacterium]